MRAANLRADAAQQSLRDARERAHGVEKAHHGHGPCISQPYPNLETKCEKIPASWCQLSWFIPGLRIKNGKSNSRAIYFWIFFRGRFWNCLWVPGSMLYCFSDFLLFCFSASLFFLLFCFSAFLLLGFSCFSAFLLLCFLLSLLLCFSCFSAFLLFAFPASLFSLLLCFCTSVPFYFYYSTFFFLSHVFLLLYFLLLCFFAFCFYCLFCLYPK